MDIGTSRFFWHTVRPTRWPKPPDWMSFSRLREIEGCPRRWSLRSASYPDLWGRSGYPDKIYLATARGRVVHAALEIITEALAAAGCTSVRGAPFVQVMRELGGYSSVLEGSIGRFLEGVQENPRYLRQGSQVEAGLNRAMAGIREQVQALTSRLTFPDDPAEKVKGRNKAIRRALPDGTHAEVELLNDRLRWHGVADAVKLSGADCEITDYKTGTPKPEHQEQLRLYSLLWARDRGLNPGGLPASLLTLVYPTGDISVPAPTIDELDQYEKSLEARTSLARLDVLRTPPPARPSADGCRYCGVRHLCDEYWSEGVQDEVFGRSSEGGGRGGTLLVDLEVVVREQDTPSLWRTQVLLCHALSKGSFLLVRLAEPDGEMVKTFEVGKRVRLLGGLLLVHDQETPLLTLTRSSEAYLVSDKSLETV